MLSTNHARFARLHPHVGAPRAGAQSVVLSATQAWVPRPLTLWGFEDAKVQYCWRPRAGSRDLPLLGAPRGPKCSTVGDLGPSPGGRKGLFPSGDRPRPGFRDASHTLGLPRAQSAVLSATQVRFPRPLAHVGPKERERAREREGDIRNALEPQTGEQKNTAGPRRGTTTPTRA